jgi:hypothetical protein
LKTTYTEGPEVRKRIDEGMAKLFRTPKITAQNPKTEPKRKKANTSKD